MSLPSWERGLKPGQLMVVLHGLVVAPFVGAWIETFRDRHESVICIVAPFVGAWIETQDR